MTISAINYRELIKKLLVLTGESEGSCYFGSKQKPKHMTKEEWAELLQLNEEVLDIPFTAVSLPTVEEWGSRTKH